jgi:hypothetical protein
MNTEYCDQLFYVPCWYPLRSEFALSDYKLKEMKLNTLDLVRLAVNLPYIDTDRAESLEFTSEYIFEERKKRE